MVLCMTVSMLPTWALAEDSSELPIAEDETIEAELLVADEIPDDELTTVYDTVEDSFGIPEEELIFAEEPVLETMSEEQAAEAPVQEPEADEVIPEEPAEGTVPVEAAAAPAEELIPVETDVEPAEEAVPEENIAAADSVDVIVPESAADPFSDVVAITEPVQEAAIIENVEDEVIPQEEPAEDEEILPLETEEASAAAEEMLADETALTVTKIRLGSKSVDAGGTLEVTVETNASSVEISFRNAAANESLSARSMTKTADGVFTGTISVANDQAAGTYTVDTVTLRGDSGSLLGNLLSTTRLYGEGNDNYATVTNQLSKSLAGTSFKVKASETADTVAPTVKSISLSSSKISAPGSITVTVKTSEDIGNNSYITFRSAEANQTLRGSLTKTETGVATATIEATGSTAEGTYVVDTVRLRDASRNEGTYVGEGNDNYSTAENKLNSTAAAVKFTVKFPSSVPAISKASKTAKGVKLTWEGIGSTYIVLRKAEGETSYSKMKETEETSYTDTSVVSGTKYSYKVRAIDANGKTLGTSKAKSITFIAAPKVSSVSVASGAIKVKWKKVQGAEAYRVLRKTRNGKWTKLGDTTGLTYTDKTVEIGTTYSYTVRCINADGSKNTSAYTSGKTLTYLASPVLKSATNVKTGVKITWAKVTGAEMYRVFRRVSGGKWTKLTDTTSLTYTDKTAESGTKYWYAVRCVSADGKSYTSSLSASKARIFIEATVLSKPTAAEGTVTLKWAKVVGAEKYRVFRKTADGSWKKLKDTAAVKFVDKTAKAGTKYSYAIRCVNDAGTKYTSAMSTAKTITVK